MVVEFIFFLAIVWALSMREYETLLYLCVFALGIYLLTNNHNYALLISVILIGSMKGGFNVEGFANKGEEVTKVESKPIIKIEEEKKEKEKTKSKPEQALKPKNMEGFTSKNIDNSLKSIEKSIGENIHVDAGTNFMKAYESLNPEQIEHMRKDTVELIETQKVLMKTLTGMTPILENSQKMMGMFKNSFGENFMKDAMKQITNNK